MKYGFNLIKLVLLHHMLAWKHLETYCKYNMKIDLK